MKTKLLCIFAFVMVIAAANAFSDVQFGGNVDWNQFRTGTNQNDLALGGRVGFGLRYGLMAVTSFDYHFVDAQDLFNNQEFTNSDLNLKFWELNENLVYTIPTRDVHPYFGGGIGLARRTFNDVLTANPLEDNRNKLGFNVLGGAKFGNGFWQPFTEVRGTFYSGNDFRDRFVITGGVVFGR